MAYAVGFLKWHAKETDLKYAWETARISLTILCILIFMLILQTEAATS